jgi:hypothetical protein
MKVLKGNPIVLIKVIVTIRLKRAHLILKRSGDVLKGIPEAIYIQNFFSLCKWALFYQYFPHHFLVIGSKENDIYPLFQS